MPRQRVAYFALFSVGCNRRSLGPAGTCLQQVAEGAIVTPFEAALLALTLARFNQMLEAPRALHGWLATFGAPAIPLHAQLIFALPRNRQVRELVLYASSHFVFR